MKVVIFLALVVSSSANVLKFDKNTAEYEGKIAESISEEAVALLCHAMEERSMSEADHIGDHFYDVPLPRVSGSSILWWNQGVAKTAIATISYKTGCYRWEMRPCYGYYPRAFSHPCTFWIPKEYPGGKCVFDTDEADPTMAQKAVSLPGRDATQLCDTAMQSVGKAEFSLMVMPLKMNLPSDHRCETWKYTPDDEMGKWDVEAMAKDQCDKMYPEYNIEELEDPSKAGVRCIPSLSGEYECFFDDENMPVEKLIEIQNKQ